MTVSMKIVIALAIAVVPIGFIVRAGVTSAQERRARERESVRRQQLEHEAFQRQQTQQEARRKAEAEDQTRFREILDQLAPEIEAARREPLTHSLKPRGKLVVWDRTRFANGLHPAHHKLPQELRGTKDDAELTFVVVLEKRDAVVGSYGPSRFGGQGNTLAYRSTATVAAIRWPSKTLAGRAEVQGDAPPLTIGQDQGVFGGVYGELDTRLANWIAAQPRD